jgi:acyl dehydratase
VSSCACRSSVPGPACRGARTAGPIEPLRCAARPTRRAGRCGSRRPAPRGDELLSVEKPGPAPGVVTDEALGAFPGVLDADLVARYAAATRDPSPGVAEGAVVPPVALVTQLWEALQAGFATLIPDAVRESSVGGVHGEHDIVVHRPVVPGEPLRTWVSGYGARRRGPNLVITLRYRTLDERDALLAEQWWTTVLLKAEGEPVGRAAPDHTFPEAARVRPIGTVRVATDEAMTRAYAEVSGDWSEHHFSTEAARRSGFDRPFLHGLCTMAICAHGVLSIMGGHDPSAVRRVAVRFASPVFVGDEIAVAVYEAGDGTYAFDAGAGGASVVRNGLLELRTSHSAPDR